MYPFPPAMPVLLPKYAHNVPGQRPDQSGQGNEDIRVDILNVTNGFEKDGVQFASTTIIDDDIPNVSLTVNTQTINEYWGIATFTATSKAQ